MTGDAKRRVGPVHQILILDRGTRLPDDHGARRDALLEQFSSYRLWQRDELTAFLADEYGDRVARAFDDVRPYAYKTDLARYCLLHRLGGWYVDYGLRRIQVPGNLPDVDLVAFRDRQSHSRTSWAVQCGLLFARPGLDALGDAIDRCVHNIEHRYYGPTPLNPTGPAVLGQAIARHGDGMRMLLGDFIDLTPLHTRDNLAYVGADGWIWALYKVTDPGRLGFAGTNAYNDLWHAGLVYTETSTTDRPGIALDEPYRSLERAAVGGPRLRHLVLRALRDKARLRRS